jgi:hypothetical protein
MNERGRASIAPVSGSTWSNVAAGCIARRGVAQATSSALVSGGSMVGGTRQPSPTLRCASMRAASACAPISSAIDWPLRGTNASR